MVIPYILLAVIAILLLYMYLEAGWLKVSRINFTKSSKALKIVHISDIHINFLRVRIDKVRKVIMQENPDILLLTGDYIDNTENTSEFLDFLKNIKLSDKTYMCLGNHDYKAYKGNREGLELFVRAVRDIHVEVLINSSVRLEKNNSGYYLIGIDDLREGSPDIEKAFKDCIPSASRITFSHNPDLALSLSGTQTDYFFCGHFHGGQIWMPFNLEFFLLRKDKLCRMGIKRGLHKIHGINVYLNRGLGNVLFPLRFLSRPEISVYKIP